MLARLTQTEQFHARRYTKQQQQTTTKHDDLTLRHTWNSSSVDSLLSYHDPQSDDDSPSTSRSSSASRPAPGADSCVLTFNKQNSPPPAAAAKPARGRSRWSKPPLCIDLGLLRRPPPRQVRKRSSLSRAFVWASSALSAERTRTITLLALLIFAWSIPLFLRSSSYPSTSSTSSPSPSIAVDRDALRHSHHKKPFAPPRFHYDTLHHQQQTTILSSQDCPPPLAPPPPAHESLEAFVSQLSPAEYALREWIYDLRVARAGEEIDGGMGTLEREAEIKGNVEKWYALLEEEEWGPVHALDAEEHGARLAPFVAETSSVLSLPSVFSVGIHLDPALHTKHYTGLEAREEEDGFACARELFASHAREDQKLVYFLATDSAQWIDDASRQLSAPLIVSGLSSELEVAEEELHSADEAILAHTDAAVTIAASTNDGNRRTLRCTQTRAVLL